MAKVFANAVRDAANHVETQAALDVVAAAVAEAAHAIAVSHRHSGAYAASFEVVTENIDRSVVSRDPLAVSKEFGRTGARGTGASEGVYALTKAAAGEAVPEQLSRNVRRLLEG